MWRLLLTEIEYNRTLLTALWAVYLPLLVIFALFGGDEISRSQPGVMVLMWALGVIFSVFYMMDLSKTRRIRYFLSAPLRPGAVSMAKILIFLAFWGTLSAGFWTVHLLFHSGLFQWETLYGFGSLTGIALFIHACYLMAHDVKFTMTRRRIFKVQAGEFAGSLIPAALLLGFGLVFFAQGVFAPGVRAAGVRFFSSSLGGLLLLALGLGAALLEASVFSKRSFFTEQQ